MKCCHARPCTCLLVWYLWHVFSADGAAVEVVAPDMRLAADLARPYLAPAYVRQGPRA